MTCQHASSANTMAIAFDRTPLITAFEVVCRPRGLTSASTIPRNRSVVSCDPAGRSFAFLSNELIVLTPVFPLSSSEQPTTVQVVVKTNRSKHNWLMRSSDGHRHDSFSTARTGMTLRALSDS